ncbi:MAG: glycosyltransferase family 39 protein [Armatimonadota bacterium]|nr:glycosyltransferase family 39 protein [bacterium]MDW8321196.1 glycosyltransferase family 39 protein [Armatimonadota bacterium]
MNATPERSFRLALVAILALAFVLRASGIRWGIPDPVHYFSFHPDEWVILGYTLGLDFPRGQFDPHFYNYGTVYLYLLHLAILVGSTYGWLTLPNDFTQYTAFAGLYLTGRWLSVLAGVVTCWLVWEMGKRLCGYRCAAVAAFLLAIVPLHTLHCHFLTTDATAALFTTGVLLAALKVYETGGKRALITAGVLVGLASATRYNAASVLVAPLLALWLRARERHEHWMGKALLLVMVSGVAFLFFCPGVWMNPQEFWRDFGYEAKHVREGHGLVFVNTGLGWVYHYWTNLRFGLGLPLLLLATFSMLIAPLSRRPMVLILWVFALVYYLFLGSFAVRFARYLLPILPPLLVLTAWLVAEGWRNTQQAGRAVVAAIAGGIAVYTLLWGTAVVAALLQPDPRLRALEWIRREIPQGARIGFATIPWFYTPPLSPYWGELQPSRRAERAREVQQYRLVIPLEEWDVHVLRQAQVVVLSQFEVDDAVRVRHAPAQAFLDELNRSFRRAAQFDTAFHVGGILFGKRDVPHDMLYPFPRIEVWKRR